MISREERKFSCERGRFTVDTEDRAIPYQFSSYEADRRLIRELQRTMGVSTRTDVIRIALRDSAERRLASPVAQEAPPQKVA